MMPAVPGFNMVKPRRLALFLLLVALTTGFTVALGRAQTTVPCDAYGYGYSGTGCDAYSVGCDAYSVGCDAYVGECADLVITSASAPDTIIKGEQFDISYVVENSGPGDAIPSFYIGGTGGYSSGLWDNVYLSTDEQFGAGDIWIASSGNQDTLPAGNSYPVSTTANVANLPSGIYYLLFVADPFGEATECNENNNVFVLQQITVEGDDPDLVITSASAPSTITKGTPFDISLTVLNQGSGTAIGNPWYDFISGVYTPVDSAIQHDFYLSADASFDEYDFDIRLGPGNFFHQGDLLPGDSYSATESVTAANIASGSYYLIAVTDADNRIYESDETNNEFVVGQVTVEGPDPDLVVTNIDAPAVMETWPATSDITITVENQGAGTATNYWRDIAYISTDDVLDGSDFLIAPFYYGSDLAPGETYSLSYPSLFAPSGLLPGEYYLIAKTDVYNNVYESDESNNIMVQPITIAGPDLVVSAISAPDAARSGDIIDLSWTVTNQGLGDWITSNYSGGPSYCCLWDEVYFSADETLDPADTEIGGSMWPGTLGGGETLTLASGESYTSSSLTGPPTIPAVADGDYYLIAKANAYGWGEADTGNNTLARLITIDNTPPAISDISVTPDCSGATVEWTTDEPAISSVEWPGGTISDESLTTSHSIYLSGLSAGSGYSYRVSSTDAAGNTATGAWDTFTTLNGGKPTLALGYTNVYWGSMADYDAGLLSIDFSLSNLGSYTAYSVNIDGSDNTGGVSLSTGMPLPVGDIAPGEAGAFTLQYQIPSGTYSFSTTLNASAEDTCGTSYTHP